MHTVYHKLVRYSIGTSTTYMYAIHRINTAGDQCCAGCYHRRIGQAENPHNIYPRCVKTHSLFHT